MKKDILLLMLCLFCSIGAMAQTKTITGVVSDAAGEPIIGASVVEVGTTNGTITDIDGKFVLNMNPDGKIRVSYIGYQVQTIDLKGKTSFRIQMKEDSEMLDPAAQAGEFLPDHRVYRRCAHHDVQKAPQARHRQDHGRLRRSDVRHDAHGKLRFRPGEFQGLYEHPDEIGRASCRERV